MKMPFSFAKKPTVLIKHGADPGIDEMLCNLYRIEEDTVYKLNGRVDAIFSKKWETDSFVNDLEEVRQHGCLAYMIDKKELEELGDATVETRLKWFTTHSDFAVVIGDEKEVLVVLRVHKNNGFDLTRFLQLQKMLKHPLESFEKRLRISRKTNPKIKIYDEQELQKEVLDAFDEKLDKIVNTLIEEDIPMESLAPPKDGHILAMIAAGQADGLHGPWLIKGSYSLFYDIEEKEEEEDKDEEEKRFLLVQKAKTTIKAFNVKTREYLILE